jgi:aquaporin Z
MALAPPAAGRALSSARQVLAADGTRALTQHWPEYLMEGVQIAVLLLAAASFTVLVQYHGSPAYRAVDSALLRRGILAVSLGITVAALIYSPMGRRSGAHFNPAVTLTFLRLGRVNPWDALFYILFQVVGAVAGIALAAVALGAKLSDPAVNYAVTEPGTAGTGVAFAAELGLSFGFMIALLITMNNSRIARFTGVIAGALIALFIVAEAPLSGMSLNPARTLGSAVAAGDWTAFWVYLIAPALGMVLAAALYTSSSRLPRPDTAKLIHDDRCRCIFYCERHGGQPLDGRRGSAGPVG